MEELEKIEGVSICYPLIKKAVDGYINAINPCEICRHKERDTEEDYDKCSCCCFYYPSEFEILPKD